MRAQYKRLLIHIFTDRKISIIRNSDVSKSTRRSVFGNHNSSSFFMFLFFLFIFFWWSRIQSEEEWGIYWKNNAFKSLNFPYQHSSTYCISYHSNHKSCTIREETSLTGSKRYAQSVTVSDKTRNRIELRNNTVAVLSQLPLTSPSPTPTRRKAHW